MDTTNPILNLVHEINAEVDNRAGSSSVELPGKTAEATVVQQETKPFMLRFDATLVGRPGIHLPHHVPGRDPVWKQMANTHQFVDPATENRPEQSIAIWSFAADAPFFFDQGFMRINPNNPSEPKFMFSPHDNPFPKEKEYEHSMNGVLNFTLDLDIASEVTKADQVIQKILADNDLSLGTGDPKKVKGNTHLFLNWLVNDVYLKQYEKKIGFTSDESLWPKKKHANILLDNIELFSPGFTKRLNEKKDKTVPKPIRNAVYRRFHYNTNNRKDQFGIPRGTNKDSDSEDEEEKDAEDLIAEPIAKKRKSNPESLVLDQYQATNYLPNLSDSEKNLAETEIANAKGALVVDDMDKLHLNTRKLQRHDVSLSLKDQFEKYIWLGKVHYFLKQFDFIMEGKINGKGTMGYFTEKSAAAIEICYRFFINKEKTPEEVYVPNDFASAGEKFSFVLSSIDDHFFSKSEAKGKTRICPKILETNLTDNQIAKKGVGVPFFNFTGRTFDKVLITFSGHVLGVFSQDDAIKAHLVQFSALYVFDASYEYDQKKKKLPDNIRHFYEFLQVYLWDIRLQSVSASTEKLMLRRISPKVKELWLEMSQLK